ncbi:Adenine glycosylase [Sphingobium herbicidovorans NBRC 16415]|uniref:Adenine DNA glycosylase n=1 Tax=Sphingobium herbicidovorans (strain ATCC 700291 / DSM 11019 / CCUG 56400 / KCTC 2939 / LMG 18315 / NBRC 16415 / MH) TaxID=1219045 RepID=A0A086P946_SPHHM|nr:A/G-specific adenine glycosylase [Sphingobium herbicidovorans]KFG89914.1 Adenine glycosylase [Sphingobium herbicidovorans NBRC 16415]
MRVEGNTKKIAEDLLGHYDVRARRLPWRAPPGANAADPYRVWLSEVMLQQTTVAAVIPYFTKFTERWPSVEALAAADDADVMAAWAGLGYYARARNLLACARAVANERDGAFPDTEDGLRDLPGVGAYTAAAVAAIAFGRRAVVVDANVERVVARLFAIDIPLPNARPAIRAAADSITPETRAGDFAQAVMDLGATICTARAPACGICPLRTDCAAVLTADPAAFPVKAAKKIRPHRLGHGWWIERPDGHVWLVRRSAKGLLGGMRALPSSDWEAAPDPTPPMTAQWRALAAPVAHIFTHFSLALTVHVAHVTENCQPPGEGEWWPLARIGDAGLPTLFRRAADAVMKESAQHARP